VGDRIWQLTWREKTAFLYDRETFQQLDTVGYLTEGWGLTYDGTRLIMSDGTANLYFRDPETFQLLGQVQVHDDQGPVVMLNELEFIDGQVYANVWQTDRVAIIDPASGQVSAWINLAGLLQPEDYQQPVDVLNGIAYDAAGDRLFVTGKLWPKLFEIELVSPVAHLPLIAHQ
jgi:glutamine cyclotransferase